jgi:hypothetical protein
MNEEIKKTGIIVSNGRTGTQFLATYFDKNYDDVVALHEPRPSFALRRYTHAYMAGKVSDAKMATVLKRKREKLMGSVSASTYIESNGYLHGFIPVLDQVWPDPTVIHIVRDPRSYAASALNHQEAHVMKNIFNRFVPHWLPDVRHLVNDSEVLSPLGNYAAFWMVINSAIGQNAEGRESYYRIPYESLFGGDYAGIRKICDCFSLEYKATGNPVSPDTPINENQSTRVGHWRTWPPERCAELHRLCSPLMQEYGYGLEPEWLERVHKGEQ